MRLVIVLPAYREGERLGATLLAIRDFAKKSLEMGHAMEVIVVDDGSDDDTARIAQEGGAIVIQHRENRGLGAALVTGFKAALFLEPPADVIVTMDADGTMDPGKISEMIARINNGADLVIASRYALGAKVVGVPAWRSCLSIVASLVARLVFRFKGVRDYSCGFRAYRAGLLAAAFKKMGDNLITGSRGFEVQIELLRRVWSFVRKAEEVGIVLDYRPKLGASHFKVVPTAKGYLRQIVQQLAGR